MIVVPFNGVKIGVCSGMDFWDSKVKIFGTSGSVDDVNGTWGDFDLERKVIDLENDWADWTKMGKLLRNKNERAVECFKYAFGKNAKIPNDFVADVIKAYSPENLKIAHYTTKNLPRKLANREVWVSGEVMLIGIDTWNKMRFAL
jgi:hypothetical protein